ncbi:MAG TPA: phosphonoacetaldehyde hydrolase [Gemmataceae bacterium]|nr:phosphonoacetaldehyde hydrolase [Gemmataceae bacterium]
MPTRPREVKLVVFDWAGTTIDFGSCAPAGAFVRAFAARGVAVSLAQARGPMGLHKKDHIRALLCVPAIGQRWCAAHDRGWTDDDVDDLYRVVTPMQVEAAALCGALTPGVLDSVPWLREQSIRVAATTGYFREAAEAVYAAAARQGYVPDFAICADEVPAGRPTPWMIFRSMEALGVYPPAAVVKVGDTAVDIEDGLNAGAWSVGVVDSSNEMGLTEGEFAALSAGEREARRAAVRERFLSTGAHAVIDSLAAVPTLIDDINRRLARGERP